ncbi:MAG: pseudouridine-5'-phosphate glycosidase, partial [Rhodospirillales bacterium]|nr:pseudouridine-5'-phosphate glycosidase [Rhodospirillales bacterium]
GVVAGQPIVGLSPKELEHLAKGGEVLKISRRDLGFAIANAADGATTVSSTMYLAHVAGIRFFATGGIGGVHRGAMESFDISADLGELARTPVAVVCSGAKNILDLPATLECLETLGVPVIGHGTNDFPAFYAQTSGLHLDQRADTPEQVARIVAAHWGIGLNGGVVIANPVPPEAALEADRMDALITDAITEAGKKGIAGKAVTPFLLRRLAKETGGESLKANKALAVANARLAARIAVAFSRLG